MKRLVAIVIALTMLCCVAFSEEDVYSIIDEMSNEELQALHEYIGDKIEENSLQAVSPESIEMKMSSSRSDQVLVGQPLLVVDADEQLSYSMTVEYVLQGAYATVYFTSDTHGYLYPNNFASRARCKTPHEKATREGSQKATQPSLFALKWMCEKNIKARTV